MSRTSAKGEVCVVTPPHRSKSASCNDVRSSNSESPPNMAAISGASGLRTLLICRSTDGRSLIQWRERELRTASKDSVWYGTCSSSCSISLERLNCELKDRSASRCRRVGEESAAVR